MTMKKTVLRYELRIIFMLAALTLSACDNGDNLDAHYLEDFSGSGGVAGDVYFDNVAVSFQDPLAGCSLGLKESRITDSPSIDTTPTIGNDSTSDLVVYNSQEIGPTSILPGEIFYQRLLPDGTPDGPRVLVSDGLTDDKLNDVHGGNIVYTAFQATTSSLGQIVLYNLSLIHI